MDFLFLNLSILLSQSLMLGARLFRISRMIGFVYKYPFMSKTSKLKTERTCISMFDCTYLSIFLKDFIRFIMFIGALQKVEMNIVCETCSFNFFFLSINIYSSQYIKDLWRILGLHNGKKLYLVESF